MPESDLFALESARGWLMLGDAGSALAELSRISQQSRSHPEVLVVEWEIRSKLKDWKTAFEIAERLVHLVEQRAHGWILRAYAARRMPGGGLEKARELLLPALEKFPENFLIPYNLACYAAQMGRIDEAWEFLCRAIKVGGRRTVLQMANSDPDLEPVRHRLEAGEDM
ncbi:MAG: tetratricopeptide repeat protein [Verrucomicrobiae bacterium]|nr:tetratricopeptide repeat protein [Verrucomicrobiae bacterium]